METLLNADVFFMLFMTPAAEEDWEFQEAVAKIKR